MKNLKGEFTCLINQDGTSIELRDSASALIIARIKVNPLDFQKALTRLADVPCEVQFNDLSNKNFGKQLKIKKIKVEMPTLLCRVGVDKKDFIEEYAENNCPEGWSVDYGFLRNSRIEVFEDGKNYLEFYVRKYE